MAAKPNKRVYKKCIVETTGSFMLLNSTGEEINANRPSVVVHTDFVDEQQTSRPKQLNILASGLPLDATDAEFEKFLKDSNDDEALAIESFCAAHGVDIKGEPVKQERGRGRKAADTQE